MKSNICFKKNILFYINTRYSKNLSIFKGKMSFFSLYIESILFIFNHKDYNLSIYLSIIKYYTICIKRFLLCRTRTLSLIPGIGVGPCSPPSRTSPFRNCQSCILAVPITCRTTCQVHPWPSPVRWWGGIHHCSELSGRHCQGFPAKLVRCSCSLIWVGPHLQYKGVTELRSSREKRKNDALEMYLLENEKEMKSERRRKRLREDEVAAIVVCSVEVRKRLS